MEEKGDSYFNQAQIKRLDQYEGAAYLINLFHNKSPKKSLPMSPRVNTKPRCGTPQPLPQKETNRFVLPPIPK